ncbi:hypothetical protein CATRI_07630 [Corynebacterium atrinae]|uniref:hypothetical protein n=1 Tax=Corynebacterium atrinae TaxID=1336740 RepID=UPI0025B607B0|nr:hypothetical protein [Corynebacterium atrinae]WJY63598.1 hypothetical protein CATRI_07630 [Corynebacterium atrinae]
MDTPGNDPYPSTPHPEDQPNYGYGNWQESSQPSPDQPTGTGKVNVLDAIGWGFKAMFRTPLIWVLGSFLVLLASAVVSFSVDFAFRADSSDTSYQLSTGYQGIQLLLSVAMAIVGIFVVHGSLKQVDQPKVKLADFFSNVNFLPSLVTMILVQVINGVIMAVIVLPVIWPVFTTDPTTWGDDTEAMAMLGRLLGALALLILVAVLISPLTSYILYYVVDRRETVTGAFRAGVKNSLANYPKLLLFHFLAILVMVLAALITFGFAMIILMPAWLLISAMLYRQMSGGALPVPDQR